MFVLVTGLVGSGSGVMLGHASVMSVLLAAQLSGRRGVVAALVGGRGVLLAERGCWRALSVSCLIGPVPVGPCAAVADVLLGAEGSSVLSG